MNIKSNLISSLEEMSRFSPHRNRILLLIKKVENKAFLPKDVVGFVTTLTPLFQNNSDEQKLRDLYQYCFKQLTALDIADLKKILNSDTQLRAGLKSTRSK